jgi:hypothetical protein
MASQSIPNETRNQLETLLNQWEARWRMRRLMLYLPRLLILALSLGIVVGLVIGLLRLLPPFQMLILVTIVSSATVVVLASGLRLMGRQGMALALRFDQIFELQERLSTALELIDGRIKTAPEIAEHQLEDTYRRARAIDPSHKLRFEIPWLEWAGVLVTFIVFIVVIGGLALMNSRAMTGLSGATQIAVDNAAESTRDITTEIATDSSLTDEERDTLLESAETTLAELENPNTTAEDAFVAMSELESDLRQQSEAVRNEAEQDQSALSQASDILGSPSDNEFPASLNQQLSDWGDNLDTMSPEEQHALAERFNQASEALDESNPELSDALQRAADALNQNNTEGAQAAMETAGQEVRQASESIARREQSANSLEQSANQAASEARDIAASESQSNRETNTDSPSNPQESQPSSPQSQSEGPPQEGMSGQQGPQGNNPQEEGQTGDAIEGETEGSVPSESSQQQSSGQEQREDGTGQSDPSQSGAGSGDSERQQQSQSPSSGSMEDMISDSDGIGETNYEPVFTGDSDLNTSGTSPIRLESDPNDSLSVEGDFQENPSGESTVPYNEVYAHYADNANQAINSGYVPLGVRDVVRDYFISLEPTDNGE